MKHFCGGEIIYIKEEDIWYCQRCGKKHYNYNEFIIDNQAEENERNYEDVMDSIAEENSTGHDPDFGR
jgi:ribosomal protein L37AE/L43A